MSLKYNPRKKYVHHKAQKPTSVSYLFKYGIADTQSEYKKSNKFCGYRTKIGCIYILSPFSHEKTPSCLVDQYGFKCFSSGAAGSNKWLEKKLARGHWVSREIRRNPIYVVDISNPLLHSITNLEDEDGSVPF